MGHVGIYGTVIVSEKLCKIMKTHGGIKMSETMDLKIVQLRKLKGVSQQELAEYLGVTFQSVSKWETKTTLPDITLLPKIAEYFQVSVDEVLGLKPIRSSHYIPRDTNNRNDWRRMEHVVENDRRFFWNEDYLKYFFYDVLKIDHAVDIIEFCCCNGDFGKRLLRILPEGSTYTGVDSEYFIPRAKENLKGYEDFVQWIVGDVNQIKSNKKYDISICQAALRHMNEPKQILSVMKSCLKPGGTLISIEINREIENVGLYVEGLDYESLCTSFDWRKLWKKELTLEGRDYAIGMRVPFYLKELGLSQVDVRMNDKVTFVTPDMEDYDELCDSFANFRGWIKTPESEIANQQESLESMMDFYMSRGYQRTEVEALCRHQREMRQFFSENRGKVSFLFTFGFLISYGTYNI